MGLGTPLALLLLSALVLPWLAHRMRQRDVPTVRLATIALLRQAMVVTQRKRALQDLLLMLTRMALIALAALGLAAPFVWDAVTIGSGAPQSVVLVLDDSMSMQRRDGMQTLWQQALEGARAQMNALPAGSQVALVMAGASPRAVTTLGTIEATEAALSSLVVSTARATALSDAVDLAASMLAAAQRAERRIWVASDFVGGGARIEAQPSGVALDYEALGPRQAQPNVAIVEARATQAIERPGGFDVRVQVRGFHRDQGQVPLRVVAAGQVLHETTLTLRDGQAETNVALSAAATFERTTIDVVIDGDDVLPDDDRRAVLLRDDRGARLLLVNGDPRPAHSSDELHFLLRALPLRQTTHADAPPLQLETSDASALDRTPLDSVDLVWLANVDLRDAGWVNRLRTFVEQGGALVVTAGDRMEPSITNARLFGLLPGRIESVEGNTGVGFAATEPADDWGIANEALGAAITNKRWVFAGSVTPSVRFSDGQPALLRQNVGRGRVAVWTTSIDGDWTDLPYRPGFVALTLSLVDALLPTAQVRPVMQAGDSVPLVLPADATDATVVTPQGDEHALSLQRPLVNGAQTLWPGAYAVKITDNNGRTRDLPRSAFVVAAPSSESDLTPSPLPESSRSLRATSTTARARRPLDTWLFAALVPLLLLEALLRAQRRKATTA